VTTLVTAGGEAAQLLDRLETRRLDVVSRLDAHAQRTFGQFFTPRKLAERIAALPRLDQAYTLSVLDAGAGVGVLAAALTARVFNERPDLAIHVTAVEADKSLFTSLRATLEDCRQSALRIGIKFDYDIEIDDFISWGHSRTESNLYSDATDRRFDLIIENPPYAKLAKNSSARKYLAAVGVEVPNVYAAFLSMSTRLLTSQGQLVAITPRSFCNGAYFRPFRRDLLHHIGIDRICVFHERDRLFADSAVLQETIIFSGTFGCRPNKTIISTSRGYADQAHERPIPYEDLVRPDDADMFFRIPTDDDDDKVSKVVSTLQASLTDLGVQVSTGRVVDFRATDYLRAHPQAGTVPLIYPHHFRNGRINWPSSKAQKPNAILHTDASKKLLLPNGVYVLVKRLSSKEEERRVVPCIYHPDDSPTSMVAFENHLNVLHTDNHGVEPELATGLAAWLSSSILDLHFRQFSGHTQVNATDLRNMRYPDRAALTRLGSTIDIARWPTQDEIDKLVEEHVLGDSNATPNDGKVTTTGVEAVGEARELLGALNFDAERSNERSALVLLALAQLRPGQPWTDASNPLLRTVEIMDFLRQFHGKDYKPNTRETIRRQTLHQFVEAGLVLQNPDLPQRPTNSPKWCYQVTELAIELIRRYKSDEFEVALRDYLTELPGLRKRYAAAREMARIPVTLPGGGVLKLSPGGQNDLIRDIIEEFCPYFTPGGLILYIGDSDSKWSHAEMEVLKQLGVVIEEHGKMPDLVIHMADKNWLVLLEAASSHGPVDAKRHGELQTLFAGSKAGLVFVSCFPTRAEMRKYLKDIAWESEAWCADAPTHMIHFDGERFLGPYPTENSGSSQR
jgi:adenine-specific DNA-methyltransferase